MIFRRRTPHPALAGFLSFAEIVDRAQRALLAAIPTPRDDGIPLGEALTVFIDTLQRSRPLARSWHAPGTEALAARCDQAIDLALAEAEKLGGETGGHSGDNGHSRSGESGTALSFETLNARVGDVLHPLEDLADIERQLRGLKH